MKRTLLVDDEAPARRRLRQLLADHPEVHIVGEAGSVPAAVDRYRTLAPDLVFLDIQLGQQTAFEIFDEVAIFSDVIFVTAYAEHAVRAFEVNALDYLLKPVAADRLAKALMRTETSPGEALRGTDVVSLRSREGWRFVPLSTIVRVRSDGDYSEVYVDEGPAHLSDLTLKDWSRRLPPGFLRVHRQHIVRRTAVVALERRPHGWAVVLADGDSLPVGRSRLPDVRAALLDP